LQQIQKLDFVSERKRWEAEKARQAPSEDDDMFEQVLDDATLPVLPHGAPHSDPEMTEADWVAAQEEYELQQLIASMEADADAKSQHFGSDDEDYDEIFMDVAMTADQSWQHQGQQSHSSFGSDEMDMDMTEG
jgi:hypothetical protein